MFGFVVVMSQVNSRRVPLTGFKVWGSWTTTAFSNENRIVIFTFFITVFIAYCAKQVFKLTCISYYSWQHRHGKLKHKVSVVYHLRIHIWQFIVCTVVIKLLFFYHTDAFLHTCEYCSWLAMIYKYILPSCVKCNIVKILFKFCVQQFL